MIQNEEYETRTAEFKNLFLCLDKERQEYIADLLKSLAAIQPMGAKWDSKREKECA